MAGNMESEQKIEKRIFPSSFYQKYPTDLVFVSIWLIFSIASIYLPLLNSTFVRYSLTLPTVLFIPGYCFIAALFPKVDDLHLLERIALSFGLSLAIVPFIGFGLNFTPWGIRLDPIVITLTIFTLIMVIIAYIRRAILPPDERFGILFFNISENIVNNTSSDNSRRVDKFLNVLVIFVIIIAIATTFFVFASPKTNEHFSEFFILGEKGIADDYPHQIIAGLHYPMFIGVGNHENRNVTYTIEIWASRTKFDSVTNTSTILTMDLLDRRSLVLSNNETLVIPYNLSIKKIGYDHINFLLFNEDLAGDEIRGNDRLKTSYRNLSLWINE
jgi:uncharacterized membrane protein